MTRQVHPQNWRALAPLISNFAHQSSTLPHLPVPPLEATLQKFKNAFRHLARSEEEFACLCNKMDDFARADGAGPILQEALLRRKDETDNWLEELGDNASYLPWRGPIVVNISPYFGFEPQPAHLPHTPAARAASITYAAMLFRQKLRSGKLAPDTAKGVELCMDAYRWMFDCDRIPSAQGIDSIVSYAGNPNPHDVLGHVIVIRKNRFWKLKAQVGEEVVGTGDLIRQFQHIYDHTTDEYPAIGVLTCGDRDPWAEGLALLSTVPHNATILSEIHSSAFVVSLDDSTPPPENDVDVSRALWHGTLPSPTNPTAMSRGLSSRYVDKPVQFMVFDNSVAGLMGEHSAIDGTQYIRLCDEILGFLANPESDIQLTPSSSLVTPEPLDFDLTAIPEIHEAIVNAQRCVEELGSSKALSVLRTSYGKAAIKGFGVGPDGWAQMLIQVAYARLAKRLGGERGPVMPWPACTHEVVMTRRFYKGRSDSIDVVTEECIAFVQAMLGTTATREERARLLREAVKKHQKLVAEAARGEGCNKHLLALEQVIVSSSMPEQAVFADPLYARTSELTLFTSSLFSSHVGVYGWGELHPNGFGVAYMTGFDDYLQFTLTSSKGMPNAEFAEEIRKAADEFYQLFSGCARPELRPKQRETSARDSLGIVARIREAVLWIRKVLQI